MLRKRQSQFGSAFSYVATCQVQNKDAFSWMLLSSEFLQTLSYSRPVVRQVPIRYVRRSSPFLLPPPMWQKADRDAIQSYYGGPIVPALHIEPPEDDG